MIKNVIFKKLVDFEFVTLYLPTLSVMNTCEQVFVYIWERNKSYSVQLHLRTAAFVIHAVYYTRLVFISF